MILQQYSFLREGEAVTVWETENKGIDHRDHILVRPWNGCVLMPPSLGSEGDVESQDEGEWNHINKSGADNDNFFVYPGMEGKK